MTFYTYLLLVVFSIPLSLGCAQPSMQDYLGNWEGTLPNEKSFSFTIELETLPADSFKLTFSNTEKTIQKKLRATGQEGIHLTIDEYTTLKLSYQENKKMLKGFLSSGILMYHLTLMKTKEGKFTGTWNPFMVESLVPQSIFLSVEQSDDGNFAAYPFFGDQRFTGTWCTDFKQEGNEIFFRDFKTGMRFRGKLLPSVIELDIFFTDALITSTRFTRSKDEWTFGVPKGKMNSPMPPAQISDGWSTSSLSALTIDAVPLREMADSIYAGAFPNTHSVLIAKKGKLAYEAYFDGYTLSIPHDHRSGSKSVSSAMIGIAIDEGIIQHVDEKLYDFLPEEYQQTKDSQKSKIRIHDLLTMSSGFDVGRESSASEGNYQNTDQWLKSVLNAPMQDEPGSHANYGSANPYLLGVCLDLRLEQPVEDFMDEKLLAPLGISNYIIQTDETRKRPYFGGGMYLTPRDMLKFGQLYLNKGTWKGKRILSESWVETSFKQFFQLENTKDKNGYGYQWWHKTYSANGQEVHSIEARGAGGQYIFVMPAIETVVVITSGNFRNNNLLQQPETLLETYILPALVK